MFKKVTAIIFFASLALPFFSPPIAAACTTDAECSSNGVCRNGKCQDCSMGIVEVFSSGGVPQSVCRYSLFEFTKLIVNILTAAIVIIALISIVVAGYVYMTAGGDASRVSLAKSIIISSLFGIALALSAFLILNMISPQFASEVREPTLTNSPST